jgi:hypothetical protein
VRSPWLIGGLLPALFFGLDGFCSKLAARAGIGLGPYLTLTGLSIALAGGVFTLLAGDRTVSAAGAAYALAKGVAWTLGSGLVVYTLTRSGVPLGKLAPLYNTNALVTVLLALVVFAEYQEVSVPRLLGGAALIVAGATLVAKA